MAYTPRSAITSLILILVLPLILARLFFSPSWDAGSNVEADTFYLKDIPISAVLTQVLASANTTRSRGLLAHALLELQNPELTIFAGPGYGVHLQNINSGAVLQAFPDGKLPRCGYGGRYDEWGKVRGLRYAYQRIVTTDSGTLSDVPGNKVDSLLMGWPALLLERAGVTDPLNPLPPGSRRNAYGEAVDRIVADLLGEGQQVQDRAHEKNIEQDKGDISEYDEGKDRTNARESEISAGRTSFESTYVLPPLLALYAVARQEEKWLIIAVEQILTYGNRFHARSNTEVLSDKEESVGEQHSLLSEPVTLSDFAASICGNAWILAGLVRVLGVVERWEPTHVNSSGYQKVGFIEWKRQAKTDLCQCIGSILHEPQSEYDGRREDHMDRVGEFKLESCAHVNKGTMSSLVRVSSIYRLAQMGSLDDLDLLYWADSLYNQVAQSIRSNGTVVTLRGDELDAAEGHKSDRNELQSLVVMMWAARRDCVKSGSCRNGQTPSWWTRSIW